jgi:hypothetical protein
VTVLRKEIKPMEIEPFLDIGLETMCVEVAATVGERT